MSARTAIFSSDQRYRYRLDQSFPGALFGAAGHVTFLMLNPSTADASVDDPTVRRVINFAQRWNHTGLTVVNMYALRSTDPKALKRVSLQEAVGPENDRHIREAVLASARVIVAWGASGPYPERIRAVLRLLGATSVPVEALALTMDGHPQHPLYVPADTLPEPFVTQRVMHVYELGSTDNRCVIHCDYLTTTLEAVTAAARAAADVAPELIAGDCYLESCGDVFLVRFTPGQPPLVRRSVLRSLTLPKGHISPRLVDVAAP